MPTANALFALGAAGAVGATAYMAKRRNSVPASEQQQQNSVDTVIFMSPHAMARRRSNASKDFHETRKQADYHWRRNYGANFSHNSHPTFPLDQKSR